MDSPLGFFIFFMFSWIYKRFEQAISARKKPFSLFPSKYKILQTWLRLDKSGRKLAGRELYEFWKYSLYVWQILFLCFTNTLFMFCKNSLYVRQTTYICSWQIVDNIQQNIQQNTSLCVWNQCLTGEENLADPESLETWNSNKNVNSLMWQSPSNISLKYFL